MQTDFGFWLRHMREAKSEPLRVTAAAAEIDSTLLSKFERGDRMPTEPQCRALARHFGIKIQEFEARRIATKILKEYGASPSFPEAIERVQEAAAEYGTRKF